MQLVLVTHRSRAALEIADVGVVVGHDECTLELSCVTGIDAEIAAELHGTAHPLGYIDERAVGEYRRVKGSEEIIAIGDHRSEVLTYQLTVFLDGFADRAEDDTLFAELLLEGGLDGDGIHDGIDSCIATQRQTFLERDTEFVEGLFQFRVDGAVTLRFLHRRIGIVADGLIVDRWHVNMSPCRLLLLLPVAKSPQAEVQHPLRLTLFGRDEPNDLLVQSLLNHLGIYVR